MPIELALWLQKRNRLKMLTESEYMLLYYKLTYEPNQISWAKNYNNVNICSVTLIIVPRLFKEKRGDMVFGLS